MKTITYAEDLQEKLVSGVEKLATAVGSTLGPRGRNVLIRPKDKSPFITKDGVTVANHFSLEDPVENAAAEIVKQASRRTNAEAGDGTTTSTVLAAEIFKNSISFLKQNPGVSPVQLYRGFQVLTDALLTRLVDRADPIESLDQIRNIATISANNDSSIGDLVTMAIDSVGEDGSVSIENSNTSETTLDLIEGFRFDSGYASSSFITDDRRRIMKHEDPIFLITDSKLETVDQILPSLEIAAREARPFIIVCEEIEGQALAALIMNSVRGNMKVAAVKAPGYGNSRRAAMDDLATATGAKFFQRVNGDKLTSVTLSDFGAAKSIQSTNSDTVIVGGIGDSEKIQERIESLRAEILSADINTAESLTQRMTRLQSGVAIIRVGGDSEIEVTEKRHRIEDALEAVRSAQSEGVVPGAGTVFYNCSFELDNCEVNFTNGDQSGALSILKESLKGPLRTMAINSGYTQDKIQAMFDAPFEDGFGYDFLTGTHRNLIDEGIIDPFRVTRCSLKNAVSVAGSLLTTNVSILED